MLALQQFAPAGLPQGVQMQLLLLRATAASDVGDVRGALKGIEEARAIDPRSADPWTAEIPVRIRSRQFREAGVAAERALALAPNSAEVWYQKASLGHVQGDLKGALAGYERALRLDANHVESRVARAGIHIDLGRLEDAKKDIAALRANSPGEPRGAYLQALLAEKDNDTSAAREALRDVVGLLDPVPIEFIRYRPQLLMLNGLAHFGLNELEKAKPYLETFQRVQNNSPVSKLLARIYLSEGDMGRASDVLEAYLRAQPGDAQAMTLLASALMAQGSHARATSLMQDALKAQDLPELRTALGLSLIGGGQVGNAMSELEAAYRKDPGQTRAGAALVGLYLRSGQAPRAVAIAEALTRREPTNASFFNMLGLSLAQAGRTADARTSFERAVQLDDTLPNARINLARIDIATRSFDSAARRLNEVLQSDDKNPDALFEMAGLANLRGDPAESQRWLEKAMDVAPPREFRPGLALVELHLRARRLQDALAVGKRMVEKLPDSVPVLLSYSKAQLANGDRLGARSTLNNATRFADFNPAAQVEIATMQVAAQNFTGASYALDKALSGRPDFLPALVLAAEIDMRQGELAKAERRAREIADRHPRRAIGFGLLGDVALLRGQTAAALDAYRKAHQIEPSSDTLLRLFKTSWSHDGGRSSLQLAEQWIKANPQDFTVRSAQADGYARAGSYAQARAAYESLSRLQPGNTAVLNNLANVLLRLKDPGAVQVAEQALALDPGNANVIDTLGWILFQQGQVDRALQLLRDARLRQPADPNIRFHLASVLAKTGRKAEARAEAEAALRSGPAFDHAEEAQALLASLR